MDTNRCICCGSVIPEGRQVCPICENKYYWYPDEDTNKCNGCQKERSVKRTWLFSIILQLLMHIKRSEK